jgi:hypothetical protein
MKPHKPSLRSLILSCLHISLKINLSKLLVDGLSKFKLGVVRSINSQVEFEALESAGDSEHGRVSPGHLVGRPAWVQKRASAHKGEATSFARPKEPKTKLGAFLPNQETLSKQSSCISNECLRFW